VRQARGDVAGRLTLVDRARATIETEGFESLYLRCQEACLPDAGRIAAAMRAFIVGDALGVPWEGRPPEDVDRERLFELPASHGWPQGATSDDTAQMMLVSRLLAETSGRPTAAQFVSRLHAAAAEIRGLGPTTKASLTRFAETGELSPPPADPTTGPPTERPCACCAQAGSSRRPTPMVGGRWCGSSPGEPIPPRSRSGPPA
jgi:ADP-ribosylglycohydrolase